MRLYNYISRSSPKWQTGLKAGTQSDGPKASERMPWWPHRRRMTSQAQATFLEHDSAIPNQREEDR